MTKIYWIMIGLCCSGILGAGMALPTHKANLDYVRGATAMKVMHELNDPGVVLHIKAEPAGKPGISLVSGRAVEFSPSETNGLRTETKTVYTFNGQTKSYCIEIEPGCLEIRHGPFSKSVSVRVPM
jgi:hypothetical protein